jgi:hypothetical protein
MLALISSNSARHIDCWSAAALRPRLAIVLLAAQLVGAVLHDAVGGVLQRQSLFGTHQRHRGPGHVNARAHARLHLRTRLLFDAVHRVRLHRAVQSRGTRRHRIDRCHHHAQQVRTVLSL